MSENNPFNNFNLTDGEITAIINKFMPLIDSNSCINGVFDEDLKQEILLSVFAKLTKNRHN